jgi:hypothetical protein
MIENLIIVNILFIFLVIFNQKEIIEIENCLIIKNIAKKKSQQILTNSEKKEKKCSMC